MFMPLFFRFQRPIEGTIDILALTGTTAYLTYIYSGIDEVAAWTMVPYLGWLTFASYLSVRKILSWGPRDYQVANTPQVGIGYLNNWNFTDKQAHYPPKSKPAPTKYVNEAPPDKKALWIFLAAECGSSHAMPLTLAFTWLFPAMKKYGTSGYNEFVLSLSIQEHMHKAIDSCRSIHLRPSRCWKD